MTGTQAAVGARFIYLYAARRDELRARCTSRKGQGRVGHAVLFSLADILVLAPAASTTISARLKRGNRNTVHAGQDGRVGMFPASIDQLLLVLSCCGRAGCAHGVAWRGEVCWPVRMAWRGVVTRA